MSPDLSVIPQHLTLNAADGYPLVATLYTAPAVPCRAHLLMAGATGVPQRFYRRFAEHAAREGFTTLTLDYRGIGLSKPAQLKGFDMNYLDWASLDLAAAVDHMSSDAVPLFMVGHSFGGHAFGLLNNTDRIERFCTFATGAGWHGWMPPAERLRVWTMWNVIGPVLTRWKGYLPWSLLGMGEDLPLGVYQQWRHWCSFPRYFFDDPQMQHLNERFAAVKTPIRAVNALDDHWAPPASRDAFMAAYRQAPQEHITLDPSQLALKSIGHMGYFRPHAAQLWGDTLDWFQSGQPSSRTSRAT
ncbi:MAG: hypothetical protein RLZZ612_409 [Pseudomonadota bacterium]